MNIIARIVVCVALLALPRIGYGEPLTLVADEWPPFAGQELPHRGFAMDVAETAFGLAGFDTQVEILPWARIMSETLDADRHVVATLFFNDTRAREWHYSAPYFVTQVHLLQRVGAGHRYTDIDGLGDLSVAVAGGTYYHQRLRAAGHRNIVTIKSTEQAVRMVASGRADVAIVGRLAALHVLADMARDLRDGVEFAPGILGEHALHVAIRREAEGGAEIIERVNDAIAQMRDTGVLAQILDRHNLR